MKKILFLTHHLQIGGVEKSLIELLKILPPSDYKITIRCVSDSGPLVKEIPQYCKVETMDYISTGLKDILLQLKKGRIYHAFRSSLCRLKQCFKKGSVEKFRVITGSLSVDDEEYDYAVSYDAPTSLQVLYTIENVKAKIKYCWIHFDMKKSIKHSYDSAWQDVFEKFDRIVCVSDTCKQSFLELNPELIGKACIVNNLVNIDYIQKSAKETVDFEKKNGQTVLCTIGRLSLGKGYLLALDVCKKLIDNGKNIVWLIIGEGNHRKIIENKIDELGLHEHFILLGAQINPYKYINRADIYVHPSQSEGQGIALMEACILQKAIICTNFHSAYEQIEDGYNGQIVEYDTEQLYNAICHLIDCPEERERFSRNTKIPDNEPVKKQLLELFNHTKIV